MTITELTISTHKRVEFVDITDAINESISKILKKGDAKPNMCIVYVPHATAGLIVNEYEPNIIEDYKSFYQGLAETVRKDLDRKDFMHNNIDDNAEAHLLTSLVGSSRLFIIKNKQLLLGTWQRVILCEFDGPRKRKVIIKLM